MVSRFGRSRSFGDDCVKEHGVTAIPDVKEVTIPEGKKAHVIMASAQRSS